MNVSYRGIKKDLSPKLQEKLDAKFAKISKLVEKRGEKEAHVVVTSENRMHKAEITMQFYGHPLVGIASDADLFTALKSRALDKLDKQAVKNGEKWRAKSRRSNGKESANGAGELVGVVARSDGAEGSQKVYRVNHHGPAEADDAGGSAPRNGQGSGLHGLSGRGERMRLRAGPAARRTFRPDRVINPRRTLEGWPSRPLLFQPRKPK